MAVVATSFVVTGICYASFFMRTRNEELAEIKPLLTGAELLSDDQILSGPSVFRVSGLRTWIYRIGREQLDRLTAGCCAVSGLIPFNHPEAPGGCVAALHNDAGQSILPRR